MKRDDSRSCLEIYVPRQLSDSIAFYNQLEQRYRILIAGNKKINDVVLLGSKKGRERVTRRY